LISIIPAPAKLQARTGTFQLNSGTRIRCLAPEARPTADYLASMLRTATGYDLHVHLLSVEEHVEGAHYGDSTINLALAVGDVDLGPEAYRLDVDPGVANISAASSVGLFYGAQTLLQLLPPEVFSDVPLQGIKWEIPCASIEDYPRFGWRGSMLDVCRHFFDKEFVKRYIDLLALHKLNVFHLHLTDDQGWRLDIPRYPQLARVSAWRDETMGDWISHGGFFTRDDIREIIQHAAGRHVTVVPEIEMPGHARAALAAYPELSCTGGPFNVWTRWGIAEDVFCAGNDATFEFLTGVLDEVLDLFPSEFVHIGGDECPKVRWQQCPKCQARIRTEGLSDEHELQSYFIRRIETYLKSKGRRLVGWSEIREGGLAPTAVVMDWIGGGAEAAIAGHDAIMSPTTHCYFDYYQSANQALEPHAIGGFIPLEKVYEFEPMPSGLSSEQQRHILGGQANLWTEYMGTADHVEYMAYPRMVALSESLWSPMESRDLEDFKSRLRTHLRRLDTLQVNYRPLD
jgi:hexosaminidase